MSRWRMFFPPIFPQILGEKKFVVWGSNRHVLTLNIIIVPFFLAGFQVDPGEKGEQMEDQNFFKGGLK